MPIRPYSTSDLELKPSIEKRAEELHLPKSGEKPAEAQRSAGSLLDRVPGGLIQTLPVVGPSLQMVYDAARSLNPKLNPTVQSGQKAAKIKELAGDSSLIKSHDGRTNKYGKLNKVDRVLFGITDDNITNENIYQNSERIKDSEEFKALDTKEGRPIRDEVMKRGSLASGRDLVNAKEGYDERVGLRTSVRGMEGGLGELKGLDSLPAASELREIEAKLKKLQPDYIEKRAKEKRAGEEHTRAGELQTSQIEIAEGTLENAENVTANDKAYKTGMLTEQQKTTELARVKQINEQRLAEYDYRDKNSARDHEAEQLAAKLAHEASENDATRGIKMQIEMLGREDNREQRSYDRRRDERQDRQLMIMQMMKGLQQLGGGFSI